MQGSLLNSDALVISRDKFIIFMCSLDFFRKTVNILCPFFSVELSFLLIYFFIAILIDVTCCSFYRADFQY